MKVIFNISRMNWYRVLAPLIEEALKRENRVECWHHAGATSLGENQPNLAKVPEFKSGVPEIIEYKQTDEIITLVKNRRPDIFIDICPPKFSELQKTGNDFQGRPFWLLVDQPPGNGLIQFQNSRELYGCDAFAVSSKHFLDSAIGYNSQDKARLVETLKKQVADIGTEPIKWVLGRFMYQPAATEIEYLREKSILTGNSALDDYASIDREAVRKRFGVTEAQRLIVLLPFPFGYDQSAPWEQMFVRSNILSRYIWLFRHRRFDYLFRSLVLPSNYAFLRSLRKFADRNNAVLIGKLRHSRKPAPELKTFCHKLVGDEGYYPHTAAELFSIADLVVGHYSSGSLEAIALETPFLNVELPGFPYKYYCDTSASLEFCNNWPGAIWSMNVADAIRDLPSMKLDTFKIDVASRKNYLEKYASWPLGGASPRIFDYLEKEVAGTVQKRNARNCRIN